MSFTCVVIDDETDAIDAMLPLLEQQGVFSVVGTAKNIKEAQVLIDREKPQLLFLDIVLENHTAFELLDRYKRPFFETVFTSAYSHFAIQAVRAGAFDYLLKPVVAKQLEDLTERLLARAQVEQQRASRYQLMSEYVNGVCDQIAVPDAEGFQFIKVQDIEHIRAQGNYCELHLAHHPKITVTRKLKVFESVLAPHGFCRVHHSHLINLSAMTKYLKGDGGKVILRNGDTVYISKLYKQPFLKAIEDFKKL